MNFNSFFLRSFRILLLPFSLIYGLIIITRNFLYDKKVLRCAQFNLPVICVGNLSTGGTGKSPMTEYLIQSLQGKFLVATISRGYKRKTKGYALANEFTTALEIGDEPMQFHTKFAQIAVAVGEERVVAVPQLLHDKPDTQVIILDDAFQHRAIKAGLNILLTECGNLFTHDFFLPTGDLRDQKKSARRADIIIVTKCPVNLSKNEKNKMEKELNKYKAKHVFFTALEYKSLYHITSKTKKNFFNADEILLVYGIAKAKPLKDFIAEKAAAYEEMSFSDHHIFSIDDLKDINKKFEMMKTPDKYIVTTEKDAVRLIKFKDQLKDLPLFVLPVQHTFLFDGAEAFNKVIVDFIINFKQENIQ